MTSFNKWDQISSASIAAPSILWCLPVEAAKTRYRHVNVLFGPSIFPYCACPASKDSISCAHTRSHSAHLGKHSSREVINQFYGFLWESFLLSNQPPPTTTTTSTIFPSVSVFGSHLRTIHSSQLTASIPPPIASHRGIIGANWGAGSVPRRYQIRLLQLDFRRVLNLSVSYNKPGRADRKCPREIESEKTNVRGEK